jgi:hypothetical protein
VSGARLAACSDPLDSQGDHQLATGTSLALSSPMIRIASFACFVGLLAPAATAVLAGDLLDVRLSRHVMSAPGSLRVTVFVEHDEDNRSLTIEADSPAFYRSSVIPLDGSSAPRTHSVRYSNLPEGKYLIRVALYGAGETVAVSRQYVEVRSEDIGGVRSDS